MADAPNPKLRWYRITPDRLVPGLLAVEAFLLLSEWGGWFPFNRHKGWTVLIAVAAVGLTLFVMLLWLAAGLLLRWRFQYSLRSLLLLTVVVAILCSWMTTEMQWAREQREAVKAIWEVGGAVTYDFESGPFAKKEPPYPAWLRKLVEDDFCAGICYVDLANTQVTDAGLVHLQGLSRLQDADLRRTQVTDQGMKSLQEALPNCTILPPLTPRKQNPNCDAAPSSAGVYRDPK